MAKTPGEILREKFKLLNSVEAAFIDGIDTIEATIYKKVITLLRGFAQEESRITKSGANQALLLRLKKDILKIIRESTFIPRVDKFLTNFDKVEDLNRGLYSVLLGKKIKTDLSFEKKLVIENVVDSLTSNSALTQNFINPVRKVLTDSIRYQQTFKDAETNLRALVIGEAQGGIFQRYSKQVVTDSINGFDGAVNDVIRDAFQLDGFRYVGSLINTSRENCIELISGSGRFEKYAIRGGVYRTKDLPAIINLAKNRKGWNKSTTPETFAQFRGGYNCRHQVFYFKLSDEQNQQVKDQLSGK